MTESDAITNLLDEFESQGWRCEPYERMIALCAGRPENSLSLLTEALGRDGWAATFLDAAVSFVEEEQLPVLGRLASERWLQTPDSELAQSIISYLSLQAPRALAPYLEAFSGRLPNAACYYSHWPWRAASPETAGALAESADPREGLRGHEARAVLESGDWKAISRLLERTRPDPAEAAVFLADVGLTRSGELLHDEVPYHLVFPAGFFDEQDRPPHLQQHHPTWRLEGTVEARFGGFAEGTCAGCKGQLHRLLRLDAVPDGLPVSAPTELVTCLSCLGWELEEMFFRHEGVKALPLEGGQTEPEFSAGPLRECTVRLARTPARWRRQDWALSSSRENLSRIGGAPSWIQGADYPTCPDCRDRMKFLMQLDSDLPTAAGGEWLWGSGGVAYVSWCDDCRVSGALWQCT